MRKLWSDFLILWWEQMLEMGRGWLWQFGFTMSLPFVIVFGLSRMSDPGNALYIVTGSAVLVACNDALSGVAIKFGLLRRGGMLVYYGSLPISRVAFVLALLASRLALSLPGMVFGLIAGRVVLGLDIQVNAAVVGVLIVSGVSLAAVGFAMGVFVESLEIIYGITSLIVTALPLCVPMFFPADRLPGIVVALSRLYPPVYAADALRHAVAGTYGPDFWLDIGVLIGVGIAGLAWVQWRMRWSGVSRA